MLSLNLDKANIMNFMMQNYPQYAFRIGCYDKCTEECVNTKSLALQINKSPTLAESHLSKDFYVMGKMLPS
jgi:hypothetical protein